MLIIFSGIDDQGKTHKITTSPHADWYSCWARMSSGDTYYCSLNSEDSTLLNRANLAVVLLFNNCIIEPERFEQLRLLLQRLSCPVIFEWENILFYTPYLGEPLERFANMLGSITHIPMYDFYIDPETVPLRNDYMLNCQPIWTDESYFDTEWQKQMFNPDIKKDGSILVIYDARDSGRNGYWSHKYANDLAHELHTEYRTHKGYGGLEFDYRFFDRRSILDMEKGLPWEQYAYHVEHASLIINLEDRPWQGRLAMDAAAAKTPYLCLNRPILHYRLWGDVALDNWHRYKQVMKKGFFLYRDGADAAQAAYDKLSDIDYRSAKGTLKAQLGFDF